MNYTGPVAVDRPGPSSTADVTGTPGADPPGGCRSTTGSGEDSAEIRTLLADPATGAGGSPGLSTTAGSSELRYAGTTGASYQVHYHNGEVLFYSVRYDVSISMIDERPPVPVGWRERDGPGIAVSRSVVTLEAVEPTAHPSSSSYLVADDGGGERPMLRRDAAGVDGSGGARSR